VSPEKSAAGKPLEEEDPVHKKQADTDAVVEPSSQDDTATEKPSATTDTAETA